MALNTGKVLLLGGAAVGGYLLYTQVFSPAAPAVAAGGAGGGGAAPPVGPTDAAGSTADSTTAGRRAPGYGSSSGGPPVVETGAIQGDEYVGAGRGVNLTQDPGAMSLSGLAGFARGLGAYLGLGADLPECSSVDVPAGFVGPVQCQDSNALAQMYSELQSWVGAQVGGPSGNYDAAGNLIPYATTGGGATPAAQSGGVTAWLNQNSTTVMIAAAAIFGFALLSGGKR